MQARKTILLVEDEVLIALAEAQSIEGFGYRVLTAHTGENAVVIATGIDKPDLILMDIDLGKGISGPDAAVEILSRSAIPIVFLTSHAERDMVEKVRGITRYGYVIKDSGDFVLQSSIEMAFELHSANELLKGELAERRRTEDRLAHSHQLMHYVIQHSRSAIAVHDTGMRYVYVSQRYLTDYNVKEKDIIGKHHYEVFPDLPEKWREVHRLALAGKVSSAEDDPYEREDGSVEWTRWECRPWYEGDGSIGGIIVYTEVITERKKAEERLKDERNLLMTIIDAIPDEIAVKDLERRFMLVNPPCVRALGKPSADEVVGKRDEDLIAREFVERSKLEEEQLLLTGTPVLNAEGRPRLDPITGEIDRALLVSRSPIRDRNGALAGLVVISRDITERKRTEVASHTLEHQFRLVWEKSTDGMRLTNEDGTILRVNEAFCRMVGKERSELEAHSLAVVYEKGRQEHVSRRHQERFRSRTVESHFEREVTLWNGKTMWVEVSNSFLDFAGQPSVLLGIFHDITERKRSEARIEALFAEREVLLKEVHHRIKNNMHTMMSLLSLQSRSMTDPGAVAAVKDARSRMQSMMVLYDKLYRSEGFKELPINEYLVPLVGEIVENLPNAGMVAIETHVEDFILQAQLLSPLGIIVNELLSNAMKYAFTGLERGTISIAASLKDHRATLVVQDDGIGLPAGLDLKTSTGFGLRLVDMLTEQMGGSMKIERNKGTRFILEFEV
ncbi:MAG: PAS domain S-box protein [Ignavibacteriae bacterium]|nr:PAS domain S-box protein [Ignavibacteriota bacterium]